VTSHGGSSPLLGTTSLASQRGGVDGFGGQVGRTARGRRSLDRAGRSIRLVVRSAPPDLVGSTAAATDRALTVSGRPTVRPTHGSVWCPLQARATGRLRPATT
ncbi:MAG: hypothetical protein ACK58T_30420, partial [Phycisphaerae bacterium]